MPTTKALFGQTWVDIVLQETGDEHRLFEICDLNGSGITDTIILDNVITVPDYEKSKERTVRVLREINPSSTNNAIGDEEMQGIEFWEVETEFLVS